MLARSTAVVGPTESVLAGVGVIEGEPMGVLTGATSEVGEAMGVLLAGVIEACTTKRALAGAAAMVGEAVRVLTGAAVVDRVTMSVPVRRIYKRSVMTSGLWSMLLSIQHSS